jgi:hypothetical protein
LLVPLTIPLSNTFYENLRDIYRRVQDLKSIKRP